MPIYRKTNSRSTVNGARMEIVETYSDVMSGAKDKRPALDRLMADARRGKFDVVAVWRLDRFARSTAHLLRALEEFQSLAVDFVSLREAIDTRTPTGKMVFTILASVAELERSTIQGACRGWAEGSQTTRRPLRAAQPRSRYRPRSETPRAEATRATSQQRLVCRRIRSLGTAGRNDPRAMTEMASQHQT